MITDLAAHVGFKRVGGRVISFGNLDDSFDPFKFRVHVQSAKLWLLLHA